MRRVLIDKINGHLFTRNRPFEIVKISEMEKSALETYAQVGITTRFIWMSFWCEYDRLLFVRNGLFEEHVAEVLR